MLTEAAWAVTVSCEMKRDLTLQQFDLRKNNHNRFLNHQRLQERPDLAYLTYKNLSVIKLISNSNDGHILTNKVDILEHFRNIRASSDLLTWFEKDVGVTRLLS